MTDERAREGVVHLQAAALELIAAGRAFLDIAEELVREPGALAAFLQVARTMAAQQRESDQPAGSPGGADDTGDRVTRIRVT